MDKNSQTDKRSNILMAAVKVLTQKVITVVQWMIL
ncbi:MAG: hypothetical protein CM15mP33_09290 [Candidatus Neomarinimicrobiota bacterium]|nr:MAG: hypothetical protein CM15mP33_09290 [Candidatus Neomarinimicrobiota bacterium]